MDFKVLLSDQAIGDLEQIVAYVARDNPVAAERLGNQLLDSALALTQMPERGRIVPEFHRRELREIIFRSYRIIYRVQLSERSVEVVRIWHSARGFPHISRGG